MRVGLLVLLACALLFTTVDAGNVNVVLFGCLGNLAKKYLWQALFNLQRSLPEGEVLSIIGTARSPKEEGEAKLEAMLIEWVRCEDIENDACHERWKDFKANVVYVQTKEKEHYAELKKEIDTMEDRRMGNPTVGTIFYLSVPSSSYYGIVNNIHKSSRPKKGWMRLVFEKPFGRDEVSSRVLSRNLDDLVNEDQIYRIDHYLGKQAVEAMRDFRLVNGRGTPVGKLWNRESITGVEIWMQETETAKGRTNFYRSYGVLRDVFQNHLSEMMALVAMDFPKSLDDVGLKRLQALEQFRPAKVQHTVVGQYSTYCDHLVADNPAEEAPSVDDHEWCPRTPTYANVALFSNSADWIGVPFVLGSGKGLSQRQAFAKISFRGDQQYSPSAGDEEADGPPPPPSITFQLQGGAVKGPAIVISRSLPKPNLPEGWVYIDSTGDEELDAQFIVARPSPSLGVDFPYYRLLRAVYEARKELFVGTKHLARLWSIWNDVVVAKDLATAQPFLYDVGEDDYLETTLELSGEGILEYSHMSSTHHQVLPLQGASSFLGFPVHSGEESDLLAALAQRIGRTIQQSYLNGDKEKFHLALSGGSTGLKLAKALRHAWEGANFWWNTHIWMVDERCVGREEKNSNFGNLYRDLLAFANSPYEQMHHIPVDQTNQFCDDKVLSDLRSDIMLVFFGTNGTAPAPRIPEFDLLILGFGEDGHVASLFPNAETLVDTKWMTEEPDFMPLAHLVEDAPGKLKRRVTFSLPLLRKAKEAIVLGLGGGKYRTLTELARKYTSYMTAPDEESVIGEEPAPGQVPLLDFLHGKASNTVSWYLDADALPDLEAPEDRDYGRDEL